MKAVKILLDIGQIKPGEATVDKDWVDCQFW
jgi:hypothetical protein